MTADANAAIEGLVQAGADYILVSDGHGPMRNLLFEEMHPAAHLLTGTGNLKGTGNELGNHLVGNSGSNVLVGRGGNDTLQGGAGVDRLDGGAGNDIYITDAADVVMELASGGTADLIRHAIDVWRTAIAELLSAAATSRALDLGDVDALADHVFVTFEGAFLLCRSTGSPEHMRAQLRVLRRLLTAALSAGVPA